MINDDLLKRLEVKAIGEALPTGSTTNDDPCPWCGHNKSFSVSHTWKGDIAFICHRASCGEAGYVKQRGVRGPATQEREFTPRLFTLATEPMGAAREADVLAAYGVSKAEIDWAGWVYSPDGDRRCMPVRSPYRAHRGWITRRLTPGPYPKSDTFREVDDLWMAWHIRSSDKAYRDSCVVVVEDNVSSLIASRFYPSVAIMGTHLNEGMILEIVAQHYNVRLCLDADATDKAFGFARKYNLFGNFVVVPLSKDLKDCTTEELKEWSAKVSSTLSSAC